MNGTSDNIIVNSCELTPIYLIQESGVTQATSYVLTPANQIEQKPLSNLKRFYESSGNLVKSVLLNSSEFTKPKILKKVDGSQIGNNLKLASFLVPKTNGSPVQNSASLPQNSNSIVQNSAPIVQNNAIIVQNTAPIVQNSPSIIQTKPVQQVNNIVFKPTVATVPASSSNVGLTTIPKLDMDRKIVKLKPCDTISRHFHGRSVPKPKPKEVTPEQPKYTSVQLLKLGETYHSLNVLSEDQVKMVNQALNIIKDPEKIPTEPAYDPVTNTRFIYKIVSPKDLKVVGKNKVVVKEKRAEPRKDLRKVELVQFDEEEASVPTGPVTTRSGRTVRLPRALAPEPAPPRARKRSGALVTCAQCSAEFGSLYQLQKHQEAHPAHAAAPHTSLFHCLRAIVAGCPAEARARLLAQQLEQLAARLRALLPCLLAGREPCRLGEHAGRIFGVTPGKYNLNVDALNCVKDKEGHCEHNPAPGAAPDAAPPPWADHADDAADTQHSDCARINSANKWPSVNNKLWNTKQKSQKNLSKKPKVAPDSNKLVNANANLGEDLTTGTNECTNVPHKMVSLLKNDEGMKENKNEEETIGFEDENKKSKPSYVQFHSTHFDIRSSPIKPSSAMFQKFQINPDQLEKLNVQIIRPLSLDHKPNEIVPDIPGTTEDCSKLENIFQDDIEMTCKNVIHNELSFDSSKDWAITSGSNVDHQSDESYIKSNAVIEPSLIHVKDDVVDSSLPYSDSNADMPILNDSNENNDSRLTLSQSQSVLNFLETLGNECLTYPEPEIRNTSVDFQLDLFSFNNT